MFEAILPEAHLLKRLVDSLKDLVQDVNLLLTPTGLSMQAMDSSHVALVSLLLPNVAGGAFTEYRCDRQFMSIGISMGSLAKVMKLGDAQDEVVLQAGEEANCLKITFRNPKTQKTTEFSMNLVEIDEETLQVPETVYNSVVVLNSSDFAKTCLQMHTMSETLTIQTAPDSISFSVDGELGSGKVTISSKGMGMNGKDQTHLEVVEPVRQSFALKYLTLFNKAASLSPYLKLQLHAEQPLQVEFTMENEAGHLKFFLAPKISDE